MAIKLTSARVVSGRLIPVYNSKRKRFGKAKLKYYALWVESPDGKDERCLLLTENDLSRLTTRACKNTEDIPKKGILANLLD